MKAALIPLMAFPSFSWRLATWELVRRYLVQYEYLGVEFMPPPLCFVVGFFLNVEIYCYNHS